MSTTDQQDRAGTAAVRGTAASRVRSVTGDLAGAVLSELREELARAEATDDLDNRRRVHELLAGCLAARGQWQDAYRELRTAVDLGRGRTAADAQQQRLLAEVALLRRETEEATRASLTDSLTETHNRRFLDQALCSLTAQRAGDPAGAVQTCVALVDLDLFKKVNDGFGHATGDQVLQRVVELLQVDLPDRSFCARYGGEEFVLVLPGVDLESAVDLCERARARIEGDDWSRLAPGLRVTVSIGVASPRSSEEGPEGAQNQLLRADSLLYAAKRSGRNAVAFRRAVDAPVELAGPAAGRRDVPDPERP